MDRIVIAGCPGAGKSTAARRVADITGLPLVHLDHHYWRPGWKPSEPEVWRDKVQELVGRPRWIMDGNYGSTLDLRLAVADTLIHLDYPTHVCARRVIQRTLTALGRVRGDEFPDGCPERWDWPFFRFVLNYRRTHRDIDLERTQGFEGTVHRFTSPRQLELFLRELAGVALLSHS